MPDLGCLLRLVWPVGRTTMPELDQPLMVVVLEMMTEPSPLAAVANTAVEEGAETSNITKL
jgi:hypothetical protein